MNLKNETVSLLKRTDIHNSVIAKECKVSPRWLAYLSSGADRGYDVTLVQRVYDYLHRKSKKAA